MYNAFKSWCQQFNKEKKTDQFRTRLSITTSMAVCQLRTHKHIRQIFRYLFAIWLELLPLFYAVHGARQTWFIDACVINWNKIYVMLNVTKRTYILDHRNVYQSRTNVLVVLELTSLSVTFVSNFIWGIRNNIQWLP